MPTTSMDRASRTPPAQHAPKKSARSVAIPHQPSAGELDSRAPHPSRQSRLTAPRQKGLVEPTLTYGPLDQGSPAKGMVMMLHGAGDSADGMMGLAQDWAEQMPHVVFVMPSAPVRGQYSAWFARQRQGENKCWNFETIVRELLELLDSQRRGHDLKFNQVALWGYSAGSLMASWLALQLREHCACLVLLHGLAPDKRLPNPPPSPSGPRPTALVLAGGADTQIPPKAVEMAVKDLKVRHGFHDVVHHVAPSQGHGIGDAELRVMREFLQARLGHPDLPLARSIK